MHVCGALGALLPGLDFVQPPFLVSARIPACANTVLATERRDGQMRTTVTIR